MFVSRIIKGRVMALHHVLKGIFSHSGLLFGYVVFVYASFLVYNALNLAIVSFVQDTVMCIKTLTTTFIFVFTLLIALR